MADVLMLAQLAGFPADPTRTCMGRQSGKKDGPKILEDPIGWAQNLCNPQATTAVEGELQKIAAPQKNEKPLYLRLCIQSASDLAAGDATGKSDPYVEVNFNRQSFCTPVRSQTLNPVWDHVIECEIKEPGVVQFKVYDQDLGRRGLLLGSASFPLSKQRTKLKREVLQLSHVPSGWFKEAPRSRLTLLWHSVDSLENQPDLLVLSRRVLEGKEANQLPQTFTLSLTVLESSHMKENPGMVSAIRVQVADGSGKKFEKLSSFGAPAGSSFIYGGPNGWRVSCTLPDLVYEDFFSYWLTLEWMLKKTDPLEEATVQYQSLVQQYKELQQARQKNGDGLLPQTESNQRDEFLVPVLPAYQAQTDTLCVGDYLKQLRAQIREKRRQAVIEARLKNQPFRALTVFGRFKIGLDEIFDFCDDVGVQYGARAKLSFKGVNVGHVLVHIDFRPESTATPRPQIDLHVYPPPFIKSVEDGCSGAKEKGEDLFLYAYADFLPDLDPDYCGIFQKRKWEHCDPFLNITVQGLTTRSNIISTSVITNRQREIEWEPVAIPMPKDRRKARLLIELYDSDSLIANAALASLCKTLVGEVRVGAPPTGRPIWYHLYGGAPDGKRADFNTNMIRRSINPPSTYHGSLCLLLDKKRAKRRFWPPFPEQVGVPMKLQVKLLRGLYLPEKYWNKNVTLFIRVAGCLLGLTNEIGVPLEPEKDVKLLPSALRSKRELSNIPSANADLLGFPGRVNDKGVLRFHPWTKTKSEVLKLHEAARRAWLKTGKQDGKPKPRLPKIWPDTAWVCRESSTLTILPRVEWCYIYIVIDEEDANPPEVFGRLPLQYPPGFQSDQQQFQSSHGTASTWPPTEALKSVQAIDGELKSALTDGFSDMPWDSPLWKLASFERDDWIKLHWDQSVVDLPKAHYTSTFAGALCGSARLFISEEEPEENEAVDDDSSNESVSSPAKEISDFLESQRSPPTDETQHVPAPKETTRWCGFENIVRRRAPPGISVKFQRLKRRNQRMYLHADVLQGSQLPGLELDGLLHPCWELNVDEEVVPMIKDSDILPELENVPNSVYPSFLQRAVIGFDIFAHTPSDTKELGRVLKGTRSLLEPLPPVVLKLYGLTWISDLKDDSEEEEGARKKAQDDKEHVQLAHLEKEILMSVMREKETSLSFHLEAQKIKFQGKTLKKGRLEKSLIATIVEWNVKNLDKVSAELSLNKDHTAIWYDLENNDTIPFHDTENVNIKAFIWRHKTKILCSFGFSKHAPSLHALIAAVGGANAAHQTAGILATVKKSKRRRKAATFQPTVLQPILEGDGSRSTATSSHQESVSSEGSRESEVESEDWGDDTPEGYNWSESSSRSQLSETPTSWPVINLASGDVLTGCSVGYFRFDLDLLGLREVGSLGLPIPAIDRQLIVTSFWAPLNGSRLLGFDISGADLPGVNLQPTLFSGLKELGFRPAAVNENLAGSGMRVGTRIRSPIFATPIIDYLQPLERRAPAVTADDRVASQRVRVLMPDVTFRLNDPDDRTSTGALSLALQEYQRVPQGSAILSLQFQCPSLKEKRCRCLVDSLEEREKAEATEKAEALGVPESDKPIRKQLETRILATIVFVDAFSEASGLLTYDDNLFAGRSVLHHELFHIVPQVSAKKPNDGSTSPVAMTHLFNADDYFLGWGERQHTSFIQPVLRLAAPVYLGHSSLQFAQSYDILYSPKDVFYTAERVVAGCRKGCNECGAGCKSIGKDSMRKCKKCLKCKQARKPVVLQPHDVEGADYPEIPDMVKNPHPPIRSVTATLGIEDWSEESDRVNFALTTWVRQVGHVVSRTERGSSILARLQMMRRATAEEKAAHLRDHIGTFNMVNICSPIEGVVVWRTPVEPGQTDCYYEQAGEVICAIQSFRDRKVYTVLTPSFDLRYPTENGYFVLNTQTQCFFDTEETAIQKALEAYDKALAKSPKKAVAQQLLKAQNEFKIQSSNLKSRAAYTAGSGIDICHRLRKTDDSANYIQAHLGFDEPFEVEKGDFVCRLMKLGTHITDRAQSVHWYDVMDTLPVLNLNRVLYTGEEHLEVGRIVGCLRIDEVTKEFAEDKASAATSTTISSAAPKYEQPILMTAPENLGWRTESLIIHLYVLTARHLDNVDILGKSDPFLKISCGTIEETSEKVFDNELNPNFYERFTIPILIPGDSNLHITVIDKGDLISSNTIIGSVVIDLENRWLALKQLPPPQMAIESAIKKDGVEYIRPMSPTPLEVVPLTKGGTNVEPGITTGYLRYILEMYPESQAPDIQSLNQFQTDYPFELRVVIWNVTDISVFKDTGQRNDLQVETVFRITDTKWNIWETTFHTDVHEFAHTEAYFNWRIVMPLRLPLMGIEARFTLIDVDGNEASKPIFETEKRSLDDLCRVQIGRFQQDDPLLPAISYDVEFCTPIYETAPARMVRTVCCGPLESLGLTHNITRAGYGSCLAPLPLNEVDDGQGKPELGPEFCACCLTEDQRRARLRERNYLARPAKLHCTFELLPEAEAKKNPAGTERNGPQQLPKPPKRVMPGMMFRNPIGYLKIILGPQTCAVIQVSLIALGALCGTLLVVFIVAIIAIAVKVH